MDERFEDTPEVLETRRIGGGGGVGSHGASSKLTARGALGHGAIQFQLVSVSHKPPTKKNQGP